METQEKRKFGTIQEEYEEQENQKVAPVTEGHKCLVCQLDGLNHRIETMILETIDPMSCRCDPSSPRAPSTKRGKGKNLLGRKIGAVKDILLGNYKTEKAFKVIARPYIRGRLG